MVPLAWHHLGRLEYAAARRLQESVAAARAKGGGIDLLLTLEHPPVVTLGRRGIAQDEEPAAALTGVARVGAVPWIRVGRGGGPTYHGPGQLVGYPVVALGTGGRGVRTFVTALEDVLCAVARHFGVAAVTRSGLPGAWVVHAGEMRKLGSIGLAVRRGVTLHGLALNVRREAEAGFAGFNPCGLDGVAPTSLEAALDRPPPSLTCVAERLAQLLAERCGYSAAARVMEPRAVAGWLEDQGAADGVAATPKAEPRTWT